MHPYLTRNVKTILTFTERENRESRQNFYSPCNFSNFAHFSHFPRQNEKQTKGSNRELQFFIQVSMN